MDEARTRSTQTAQEKQNMKPANLNDMVENKLQVKGRLQHTHLVQVPQAKRNKVELGT